MTQFLITRRECFEIILIVAIICSFLMKQGKQDYIKSVIVAVIAAIFASILFAFGLSYVEYSLGLHGYKALYEGVLMIATSLLLLHMIGWMQQTVKSFGNKTKILSDSNVTGCQTCPLVDESAKMKQKNGSAIKQFFEASLHKTETKRGVGLLVFLTVVKEGAELVMMLLASGSQNGFSSLGFFAGIGAAGVMGYVMYVLEKRLPLAIFFRVSSCLLLIFAAMMMSGGIHELIEYHELSEQQGTVAVHQEEEETAYWMLLVWMGFAWYGYQMFGIKKASM